MIETWIDSTSALGGSPGHGPIGGRSRALRALLCFTALLAVGCLPIRAISSPDDGNKGLSCGERGTVEGRPLPEWCSELQSPETQLRALEVLQVFGRDAASCRSQVEKLLRSESEAVREAALLVLEATVSSDQELQAILSATSKDASQLVRSATAQIAGHRFASGGVWSEWITGLIALGLEDRTIDVRAAWLGALSRISARSSISRFTEKVLKLSEHDDPFLRRFCIRGVGACARSDDVRARAFLLRAVKSTDKEEQCLAALALMRTQLDEKAGNAVVLSHLADKDPEVQSYAIMNLNGPGIAAPDQVKAIGALILSAKDARVRTGAVNYFVHRGESRDEWRFNLERALKDSNEEVSDLAAIALLRGGLAPPIATLNEALLATGERPTVLLRALRAKITGLVDPTDESAFEAASAAAAADVREGVALAIGYLPSRPHWADRILERLMCHDRTTEVRSAARDALRQR